MPPYRDPKIECTETGVVVHGYYFPVGSKTIPYSSIRSMERFTLTALRGKARIWGSGDFRHWSNLDLGRPGKEVGFRIDLGRRVVPVLTPDDPDAFACSVEEHRGPLPNR